MISCSEAEAGALAMMKAFARRLSEEEQDTPELPDPNDEGAWRKLEREARRALEGEAEPKRQAADVWAFARPFDYAAALDRRQKAVRSQLADLAADLRGGKWSPRRHLMTASPPHVDAMASEVGVTNGGDHMQPMRPHAGVAAFTLAEVAHLMAVGRSLGAWPKRRGGRRPNRARMLEAAVRCYQDSLTDEQIAARVGVSRRTLARWKHRADFRAMFEDAAAAHGGLPSTWRPERSRGDAMEGDSGRQVSQGAPELADLGMAERIQMAALLRDALLESATFQATVDELRTEEGRALREMTHGG